MGSVRPPPDEQPLVRMMEETQRQVERVLDHQVHALGDELRRTESMIRLGVATLAGTIAVTGLLLSAGARPDALAAWAFGASILMVLMALAWWLDVTTGPDRPHGIRVGPDPSALAERLDHEGWSSASLLASTISEAALHHGQNGRLLASLARRRSRGTLWLFGGVVLHLAALAFIAGGRILG